MSSIKSLSVLTISLFLVAALSYWITDGGTNKFEFLGIAGVVAALLGGITFIGLVLALVIRSIKQSK